MPRTELAEGLQLYHLALRQEDFTMPHHHLLFADMSGEFYSLAKDDAAECRRLTILKRANHLALLIDCERILAVSTRQSALDSARQLLRRCTDEKMIGRKTGVQILFAKWDYLKKLDKDAVLGKTIRQFKDQMNTVFGPQLAHLDYFNVAASPTNDPSLPVAYGTESLVSLWANPPEANESTPPRTPYSPHPSEREFGAFVAKRRKQRKK